MHVPTLRYRRAFIACGVSIVLLPETVALRMSPMLCESTLDPAGTPTIYDAAASQLGPTYILTVVAIGGPLVLAYTWFVYRTFRGKFGVESGESLGRVRGLRPSRSVLIAGSRASR